MDLEQCSFAYFLYLPEILPTQGGVQTLLETERNGVSPLSIQKHGCKITKQKLPGTARSSFSEAFYKPHI